MHAKLFVKLGVEVGSRLALISTQLNSSLAATVASLCILQPHKTSQSLASHCRRSWLTVSTIQRSYVIELLDRIGQSHSLFLSLMAHLD
jgi:hypothetical protein